MTGQPHHSSDRMTESPEADGGALQPTTPHRSPHRSSYRTPHRSPGDRGRERVSPCPQRNRTPSRVRETNGSDSPPQVARARTGQVQARDDAPSPTRALGESELPAGTQFFRLIVRPIIKQTVGQRDSSGSALKDHVVTGAAFHEIITKLWEVYRARVKGQTLRDDNGNWSVVVPELDEWPRLMQFKFRKKVVEQERSETEWHLWLVRRRNETMTLLIYEYGIAIQRQQDYDAFTQACIQPTHTDRAGASAERSLREIVAGLQEQWSSTFDAEQVVWRMWANHITRNLERSTWEAALAQPPPTCVTQLLRPARLQLQEHLDTVNRSASVALDCVNACITEFCQLRRDWAGFQLRLDAFERNLATRKSVVEAFVSNLVPPPPQAVTDPFSTLENIADIDHEE